MKTIKYLLILVVITVVSCYSQTRSGTASGVSLSTAKQIAGDSANAALTKAKQAITDTLNVNSRQFQSLQQVRTIVGDSLSVNSRGWQTATQVSQRISDSLSANVRGWQTAQQVRSVIGDSLNANSRGWRTQAQAKADAIDTLTNLNSIDNPADQHYIVVETSSGLRKSQIYNIPQETRIQQLQSLITQLQTRVTQLEEALQDTTAPTITIPVAPSNLRATVTTTRVNLIWQDNSTNEIGFQILRKLSAMTNYVPIDTVSPNVATYTDTTALPNTYYDYAVKALGTQGNSGSIEVTNVRLETLEYKFDITPASLYVETDSTGSSSGGGGSYYLLNAETGDFTGTTNYTVSDSAQFYVTNINPISGTYSYRYRGESSDGSVMAASARFTQQTFPDSIWITFKVKIDTAVFAQYIGNTILGIYNGNYLLTNVGISRSATGTGNATDFRFDGSNYTFTSLGYYLGNVAEIKIYYYEGSQTDSVATIKIWFNNSLIVNKTRKISYGWGTVGNVRFGNVYSEGLQLAYSIDDLRIADNPPDYEPGGSLVYETTSIKLKNNTDSTLTINSFNITPTNVFFIDSTQNYLVSIASGDSITRNIKVLRIVLGGSYNASINIGTQLGSQTYSMVALVKSASTTPPNPISATRWYLSPTGSGNQDGKSRANARYYKSYSTLNIQPNDTIFLVNGTYNDGTIWWANAKSGSPLGLITFMPDPQNTGDVIFSNPNDYAISIQEANYVRLKGIKIIGSNAGIRVGKGKVKYLDSLFIDNNGGTGINVYGNNGGGYIPDYDPKTMSNVDSVFIRWCYIANTQQVNTQTDCIVVMWAHGVRILNNYILQGNTTGTGHNDVIQTDHGIGDIYIANNVLINMKEASSQIIMGGNSWAGYKTVLYNNISIHYGAGVGVWQAAAYNAFAPNGRPPQGDGQVFAIHNTFIGKRYPYIVMMNPVNNDWNTGVCLDSAYTVNNIFYSIQSDGTPPMNSPRRATDGFVAQYQDNNIFAINGGTSTKHIGAFYANVPAGEWTLSQWQSLTPFDDNSTTQLPTFRNFQYNSALYNQEDLRLTSNSVGVGDGRTDIKIKGNQWVNLKTLVESFGLQWEEFNNPYVSWATGGARSELSPNIGACSVAP